MKAAALACLLFILAPAVATASATTWYIKPDGTGDAPTIQAGIDSAAVGDEVVLACGTYHESDIIMKSGITLRSETRQPDCATIAGLGGGTILQCLDLADDTLMEGLTITWSGGSSGRGMFIQGGTPLVRECVISGCTGYYLSYGAVRAEAAAPRFEDCEFSGNYGEDGGAVYLTGGFGTSFTDCTFRDNEGDLTGGVAADHASPLIQGCFFENNYAEVAGAIYIAPGGPALIEDCLFIDNGAYLGPIVVRGDDVIIRRTTVFDCVGEFGGAIVCERGSSGVIEECVLYGNESLEGGAALWFMDSVDWLVDRCTISHNGSTVNYGPASCIWFGYGPFHRGAGVPNVTVTNSILSFGLGAPAVHTDLPLVFEITLQCTDVYGNVEGDWVGLIADQANINGNFSADPLYCDAENGDYTIQSGSPCTPPGATGCGLVGALPVGCGPVSLEPESWARVKARYK